MAQFLPGTKMIEVGDTLPSSEVVEGVPLNRLNMSILCRNKKNLIVGVMGAFIPACTNTHLASYLRRSTELKKLYDEVICVTVNDIFVVEAWAQEQKIDEQIRLVADPDGDFSRAIGVAIDIPSIGGIRNYPFAMVVVNNVVKKMVHEPDIFTLSATLAERFLGVY